MRTWVYAIVVVLFIGCVSSQPRQTVIQDSQIMPINTPMVVEMKPKKTRFSLRTQDGSEAPILMSGTDIVTPFGEDFKNDATIDSITYQGRTIENKGSLFAGSIITDKYGKVKSKNIDIAGSALLMSYREEQRKVFIDNFYNSLETAEFSKTPVKTGDVIFKNTYVSFVLKGIGSYKNRPVLVAMYDPREGCPNITAYAYLDMQTMAMLKYNSKIFLNADTVGFLAAKMTDPSLSDKKAMEMWYRMKDKAKDEVKNLEPRMIEVDIEGDVIN